MKFFQQFFASSDFDSPNTSGEVAVCCPFPHSSPDGSPYLETVASAHINLDMDLFHCKVCNKGLSEASFLKEFEHISYKDARKMLNNIDDNISENWQSAIDNLKGSPSTISKIKALGITDAVMDELQIGYEGLGVGFPVYLYNTLVDVRTYNAQGTPKVKSRTGASAGYIIPFDIWRESTKPTLLCAGEKDMAIARSLGYNAITFTGGEGSIPKLFKKSFENRKVYICYDNDDAGKDGSKAIAKWLKDCGALPYIVNGHYLVCSEKGEDIHDYFQKYNKTVESFNEILNSTQEFSEQDYLMESEKQTPLVSLLDATKGEYRNRYVTSMVQVSAVFDNQFGIPDLVEFRKTKMIDEDKDSMQVGEVREWVLDEDNLQDILILMDSNLKEEQVAKNLRKLCNIPEKEGGVRCKKQSFTTVFKAVVTDLVESEVMAEGYTPIELVCFTVGKRLMSGNKYKITYKAIPHPLQQQEIMLLVSDVQDAQDSITKFSVNEEVKERLAVFQQKDGQTIEDRLDETFRSTKNYVGTFADKNITQATDLFYHTPLEFNFAERKMRGYLDVMIVGETRTGKSATAEALLKLYRLGTFTSLKTSTIAGLIGGSNKVNGSWKTTIGVIPRNHMGAIILEEFSGAKQDFIKSMTDIRSSNQVRLVRVNGELKIPAMVRMLTLSNQRSMKDGQTKPLYAYSNGIDVLLELVGASEDIARYDFFLLVGEPDEYINPFKNRRQTVPYDEQSYKDRVRWVWSRKPEQIIFADGSDEYIWDEAQKLNEKFNCHIKLFGSEADKKLARLAVAVAGCCVSTDDSFDNIIVTKEHVDWSVNFLDKLYDNQLFRLKEFVDEQKKYTEIDDSVIKMTQDIYTQHTTLLIQLEMCSGTTRANLQAVAGLDNKDFSMIMNRLTSLMLVQWKGDRIIPSVRFRRAMKKIDRRVKLLGKGEVF
jgi:5S rRNA maturation endonuclease (ribonuclease M5)